MGDSVNVRVKGSVSTVYLYSGIDGERVLRKIATGLARGEHWGEEIHLARIILDAMTEGQDKTSWYGISSVEVHSAYPLITVDAKLGILSIPSIDYKNNFSGFILDMGRNELELSFGNCHEQ